MTNLFILYVECFGRFWGTSTYPMIIFNSLLPACTGRSPWLWMQGSKFSASILWSIIGYFILHYMLDEWLFCLAITRFADNSSIFTISGKSYIPLVPVNCWFFLLICFKLIVYCVSFDLAFYEENYIGMYFSTQFLVSLVNFFHEVKLLLG